MLGVEPMASVGQVEAAFLALRRADEGSSGAGRSGARSQGFGRLFGF